MIELVLFMAGTMTLAMLPIAALAAVLYFVLVPLFERLRQDD